MAKYSDRKTVGSSDLVPYIPGEPYGARHERRLKRNLEYRERVKTWCHNRGVTLQIKNEGHHWIFLHDRNRADWWPSSAKLVFGCKYAKGVHVHDWRQAIEQISMVFFGWKEQTASS